MWVNKQFWIYSFIPCIFYILFCGFTIERYLIVNDKETRQKTQTINLDNITDSLKEAHVKKIIADSVLQPTPEEYKDIKQRYPDLQSDEVIPPLVFLDKYKMLQKKMMNGTIPERYLCYDSSNPGFGNKMLGLVTALVVAMSTDRGFALCGWDAFTAYYKLPFEVPVFQRKDWSSWRLVRWGPGCRNHPELDKGTLEENIPEDTFRFMSNCLDIEYMGVRKRYNKYFNKIGFPISRTCNSFDSYKIVKYFYNYVLLPSDYVSQKVEEEYSKWPKGYTIGIQIRMGKHADFNNDRKEFQNMNSVNMMFAKAQVMTREVSQPVHWFVVSDSSVVKQRAIKNYPKYVITYNSTIIHCGGPSNKKILQGCYDALIEMYLLSKCDNYILTSGSSFGRVSTWVKKDNNILFTPCL
ncbi:hypothetical protein WA158_003875 [Blastocystis sp. Blastoise]